MPSWLMTLFLILFSLSTTVLAKKTSTVIALNWKPEPQFGGFYEAQLKNIFKQKNLDVELRPGGTNTPTVQLAASGKVPYAIVNGDELIVNLDKGGELQALFAVYQINPQGLMSQKIRGFKNLKELMASKSTVLWQNGVPYVEYLKKKYKPQALTEAPYNGGISFLARNPEYIQQMFITSEPLIARRKGLEVSSFLVADEGFNPYNTVLVSTKKYVEENRLEAQNLISALRAGWESYLKNPKETNEYMNQLNPSMDLETFEESAKLQIPYIQSNLLGSMDQKRWADLARQMHEMGFTQKVVGTQNLIFETK